MTDRQPDRKPMADPPEGFEYIYDESGFVIGLAPKTHTIRTGERA